MGINSIRVAIISATAPHVKIWEAANPDHYNNLNFLNPLDSIRKTSKNIEGQYDVLIAAVHYSRNGELEYEGKSGSFQIVQSMPEFDVIFAGHEHALYNENINGNWVIEHERYGSHVSLAKIDLKKNEKDEWKVTQINTENISTKGEKKSEEVLKKFEWIHNISLDYINLIIGNIKDDFIKGVDYITGKDNVTMARALYEDTALVDFINKVQSFYAKAQISSASIFKSNQNIKKGQIKRKDIININKYDNTLLGINISGENLLKYMEDSARYYQTTKQLLLILKFPFILILCFQVLIMILI